MISAKARLAFVVVQLDGEVEREVCTFEKNKGLVKAMRKEPAGFLVYFPKGHVLRMSVKEIKERGFDKKPAFVDMSEMHDPNSAIGQLFFAQNSADRDTAWRSLEDEVIALATRASGKVLLPEQADQTEPVDTDVIKARPPRKMTISKLGGVGKRHKLTEIA